MLIKIFSLFGKSSEMLVVLLETDRPLGSLELQHKKIKYLYMQQGGLWMGSVYCLLADVKQFGALGAVPTCWISALLGEKKLLVIDILINVLVQELWVEWI